MRTYLWAHMTRSEIGEAAKVGALPIVPVGAVEQHGDHLPVGTDAILVEHICQIAAQISKVPVVVLPTLTIGFSPHHAQWPGTLTLSLSSVYALIKDVTSSVERCGFRRLLIVNGHGGNRAPLNAIATELITEGRLVGVVSYWETAAQEIADTLTGIRKEIGHAGELETSLILQAIRDGILPHMPQLDSIGTLPPVADSPASRSPDTPFARGVGWWPPVFGRDHCGYEGDPAEASAERGQVLLGHVSVGLARFFREFAALDLRSGGMI